ncbi:MAG: colanic acid biosynthesis glycosyl transferase WcaI, partial [Planctomycetota bacterium]|jgi:colanic acid biosynthesis glycosyl transferase WcaI
MAEWFVRRGWQVTVLTGVPHYPWWRVPDDYARRDYRHGRGDEVINGVQVRRVRHFVPAPPVSGKARMRLDASYLGHWLRRVPGLRERPDVIVGVAPPYLVGGLLLALRARFRVPVVYHVQDLQVDAALDLKMLPARLEGPLRWSERWQLERMDLVTACGRGMLPRLAAKGRLRLRPRHWPNWADVDAMHPWTGGGNPERPALHGQGDQMRVLYSGNLGRKQGLEVLVEAARLWRDDAGLALTIAGSGAERAALEQSVADLPGVQVQDLRPADRLRAVLAAADLHVIPQRREAADLVLPSKLLNILAVGRPVVVTAEPGTELAEVVTAAGAGLVVPPEDPAALATAVRALAGDPARRAAMGAAGRSWIVDHLGADAVLGRMERDLRGLMRVGRRG